MSEWLSRAMDEGYEIGLEKAYAKGYARGLVKAYAEVYAKVYAEDYVKNYAEAYAKGIIQTLWELVNDHLLDNDVASAYAKKAVAEFEERMKALIA